MGDTQCLGRLGGTFPVGAFVSGGCEGNGIHDGGATADAALGPGGCEAGHGTFTGHVALEFGERGNHDEKEFRLSGWTVGSRQCSGENTEADSLVVEAIGDGEHYRHRPAETTQFPYARGVRWPEMVEGFNDPGRAVARLEIVSSKIRPQPAVSRASRWSWESCPLVETRA